jgi:peptidoglycan/LPS O-acetylase OafA/YrhL
MLTGLVGANSIDPSYWTLSYEVIFYAGAATLWSLLRGSRRLELPCLLWLACSYIGHVVAWVPRHHRLMVFLNIPYANLFVVGMMLYYLYTGSRSRLTRPTLCAALLMALFPPEFNGGHMPQPVYIAMIVTFASLLWLVAKSNGKFLDVKPLVFLGEISYSLYLIHQVVGFALIRLLLGAGVPTNAAIGLTISAIIAVAFCLRTVVEKPAERFIKAFAKRQTQTMASPSLDAAFCTGAK